MAVPRERVFALLQEVQVQFQQRSETFFLKHSGYKFYLERLPDDGSEYKLRDVNFMVKQLHLPADKVRQHIPELG